MLLLIFLHLLHRYKIRNDPAGWLNINKDTGLIKVKSLMDRESTFVQDNKYSVVVLGIDNGI